MNTLYTFGYSGKRPERLLEIAKGLDAVVLDTRHQPSSRQPGWNKKQLQANLGERYEHIPALGNKNYRGGPIELVNQQNGIAMIGWRLEYRNVILLCVCADVSTCHRGYIARLAATEHGCKVEHLGEIGYQVGRYDWIQSDDPVFEYRFEAEAHALKQSSDHAHDESISPVYGVWTDQQNGSKLVAIAVDGELFTRL